MCHRFFLVVSLALSHVALTQPKTSAEKQQMVDAVGNPNNLGSVQTFDERYEGVKGNPFLSDQWMRGEVHMMNGKVFNDLLIKYDAYQDEAVVKCRDGAKVVPDKNTIRSFLLDGAQREPKRQFVRIDYLKNDRKFPPNHFAEVLYQGKSTLLALYSKKLIAANYRGGVPCQSPLRYVW